MATRKEINPGYRGGEGGSAEGSHRPAPLRDPIWEGACETRGRSILIDKGGNYISLAFSANPHGPAGNTKRERQREWVKEKNNGKGKEVAGRENTIKTNLWLFVSKWCKIFMQSKTIDWGSCSFWGEPEVLRCDRFPSAVENVVSKDRRRHLHNECSDNQCVPPTYAYFGFQQLRSEVWLSSIPTVQLSLLWFLARSLNVGNGIGSDSAFFFASWEVVGCQEVAKWWPIVFVG